MIPTTTLPRLALALAIPPLAALLASCDGGEGEAGRAAAPDSAKPATETGGGNAVDTPAVEEEAPASGGLANGSHAVFGLRMPKGMIPAGSSGPGVYRFEGPHPTALVESYLTTQLASFDPAVPEADARLIRNAVVRKPLGGATAGPLGIRVRGEAGGSAVDVWLERQDAAPAAASGSTAGPGLAPPGSAAAGNDAREPKAGSYGTPEQRRQAVFEMLQKIERGEPITKKDMDNPLFQ